MNFDYSEMQQMLVDTAGRFMADNYSLDVWRAAHDSSTGVSPDIWSQFAEMGWLALPLPEDRGGLGGSLEDVAVLMTAVGRGLSVEPYVSTAVLAAYILGNGSSSTAGGEALSSIASGDLRIVLAHQELDEGFGNLGPRSTTAERIADGFVLNGAKVSVLDAPSAQMLIVSAEIAREGSALFVVPADQAGITATAYPLIDGSRASDIALEKVSVPQAALIATSGSVADVLAEAFDRATVALLAQAVGSIEACLEICGAYVKERRQFGQSIGEFQVIQHLLADMFVAAHQARSGLYQALAGCQRGETERRRAISIAKLVIGEAGRLVGKAGIQIHGGYGITDEYAIGHHYRRLFVIDRQYGDQTHHGDRLGAAMAA